MSLRTVFLVITLIILSRSSALCQLDTANYLKSIYLISNELRNAGEFKESLNQFAHVLDIFPEQKKLDYSNLILLDTIYLHNSGSSLLYKNSRNNLVPVTQSQLLDANRSNPILYRSKDSTLFNGFLIQNLNPNTTYGTIDVFIYQNGVFVNSEYYLFAEGDSTQGLKFPFDRNKLFSNPKNQVWFTGHEKGNNRSERIIVYPNADTFKIFNNVTDYSGKITVFSKNGDTSLFSVTINFCDSIVERYYEESSTYYSYGLVFYESYMNIHKERNLLLNSTLDTITLGSSVFIDGSPYRDGRHVSGEMIEDEFIKLRTLWKNDTLIDILNKNLIYMDKNGRLLTKERYLKKKVKAQSNELLDPFAELFINENTGETIVLITTTNSYNYKKLMKKIKRHNLVQKHSD